MKTRDSSPPTPPPPPVHVHVPETTPVHVHMRRSPSNTPQNRTKDAQVKVDTGRSKARSPWIPPGRLSCRRDVGSYKSDTRAQHRQTAVLLRALVEAEIDGVAVANQLTALKETIDSLTKAQRLSKLQAASLGRQQELLVEKMEMFDNTNQSLRELLREWSQHERESLLWSEQRDALKKRLTDSEAENVRLVAKLTHKEKEASKLAVHLDFERQDTVKTTEELSRILESTRDHLESQLGRAEAEKIQLAAQIQRMQQSQEQQQQKLQGLQAELQVQRQQWDQEDVGPGRRDQEALTRLTQQAKRAEELAREQAERLREKEAQLAQALSTSSDWCLRHSKEAVAKAQLEEEVSALKLQVTELNSQLRSAEEKNRAEREELRDQIQQLSAENASTKLDNQRLKGESTSSEEKLRGLQAEARQLKSSIRKYENMLEKYKKKVKSDSEGHAPNSWAQTRPVQQARLQSEEDRLKLEVTQREAVEVQVSLEREKEQVRRELQGRLRELEMLPDRLRRSEQQLRDAQQEADAHERRSMEQSSTLSDVRHKVEQQGAQLETFQQRNLLLQEENNVLKEKIHNLERKVEDMRVENKEMSHALSSKEAGIRGVQQQLEEKSSECSILSRQLQQTVDDVQRQVDDSVQRVLAKERASQSKALDLQSQLSRARTELCQLHRSKDEMERRFKSQLQNLKDRLEQADSTNRSLQNYVHFLKTSYGNVFGDSLLTS
ncbi:hypothetical protein INR49_019262 [Caranx melampygus]|nr:hypothetical protein INR49_019262 [Caranx melampygus]